MNVDAAGYQLMHILTHAGRGSRWVRRRPGKAARDFTETEAAMPYEAVLFVGYSLKASAAVARRTKA